MNTVVLTTAKMTLFLWPQFFFCFYKSYKYLKSQIPKQSDPEQLPMGHTNIFPREIKPVSRNVAASHSATTLTVPSTIKKSLKSSIFLLENIFITYPYLGVVDKTQTLPTSLRFLKRTGFSTNLLSWVIIKFV